MHQEANDFISSVKEKFPDFFKDKIVLEAGSLNINGSVRQFFENCGHTGLDIGEGRDVDIVIHAKDFIVPNKFDVVITAEMLEHDITWKESLLQLYANLKNGGLMIATCAAPLREEHGTTEHAPDCSPFTTEYYHNLSTEEIGNILTKDMFADYFLDYGRHGSDLYFYGIKK